MLQSKENTVKIEGILSEINITQGNFTKDNRTQNCLRGEIKVQVPQTAEDGTAFTLEVPVSVFASELKKDGSENPVYKSLLTVKNEYVSIAAGGIEKADKVRITGASIKMNEYYSKNTGALVAFPRIQASFINRVTGEFAPEATFSAIFTVGDIVDETDKDGVETGRTIIKGILPQYDGTVDVIPFYTGTPSVASAVKSYWSKGDTVKAVGRLNFTSKTETIKVDVDFGEPTTKTRTTNVSELVVIGGSSTPLDGDNAFDSNEISEALTKRKAALEAKKIASAEPPKKSFKDLGF